MRVFQVFVAALVWIMSTGSEAILNGFLASRDEFPHQVLIQGDILCGGSIISKFWILTAAHCVDDVSVSQNGKFKLLITTEDSFSYISLFTESKRVEKVRIHREYNKTTVLNDIALLKLEKPFEWSKEVLPIQLYNGTQEPQGTAIISGLGGASGDDKTNPVHSARLRKTAVSLLESASCTSDWIDGQNQTFAFDAELMICAVGVHTGICRGDSGSSLTFQGLQIGIASYGTMGTTEGCAPPNFGVYTRVSSYLDWIDESCEGCLEEPKEVKGYTPKSVRRPTTGELKYQVLITSTESAEAPPTSMSELERTCSGSIVADSWVLTSAECFEDAVEGEKLWVLPLSMLEGDGQYWIPVARVFTDEKNENSEIALIQVEGKFEWSGSVGPVELQLEPLGNAETAVTLTRDAAIKTESLESFRIVNVDLATAEACVEALATTYELEYESSHVLCGIVQNFDGDDFYWDSGSPLMLSNGKLIGIAPRGNITEQYVIADQVAGFANWIQETCGGCLSYYGKAESIEKRLTAHIIRVILTYNLYWLLVVALVAAVAGAIWKFKSRKSLEPEQQLKNAI